MRPINAGPCRRRGRVIGWPDDLEVWRWQARRTLVALQEAIPEIPKELLRWNVFRHAFASLLMQSGVSVFKVASWLGNDVRARKALQEAVWINPFDPSPHCHLAKLAESDRDRRREASACSQLRRR